MDFSSKKFKLETLGQTAKKKKDILYVIGIVAILGILAISFALSVIDSDKKKTFKERESQVTKITKAEILPEKDYKETWAISIENSVEKQNKIIEDFVNKVQEDSNKSITEIKNIVYDGAAEQKKTNDETTQKTSSQIEDFKKYVEDKLTRQENKVEELTILAQNANTLASDLKKKDEDVIIGEDLLPPLANGAKKPIIPSTNANPVDSAVDKITGKPIQGGTQPQSFNPSLPSKPGSSSGDINNKKVKLKFVSVNTDKNKEIIEKENKTIEAYGKDEFDNSFRVMVGLSRAYMITGAYAPAFSNGEDEPLPVLLQSEGNVLIANNDTMSVDKCFLIGSAKGNMNSKTADIRLVKISCSLNDGKYMVDGKINGWVIGENGIPGVPGELLHKNGAWLAQTFVAGFMQTFASALTSSKTTQISFASNGSTSTSVPVSQSISDNAASAAAGGMSTVFGKLGEYYLKMAEQIFPVIEVKPGRTVNILLKGGETLSVQNLNKMDLPSVQEKLDERELQHEESNNEAEYSGGQPKKLDKLTVPKKEKEDAVSEKDDPFAYTVKKNTGNNNFKFK